VLGVAFVFRERRTRIRGTSHEFVVEDLILDHLVYGSWTRVRQRGLGVREGGTNGFPVKLCKEVPFFSMLFDLFNQLANALIHAGKLEPRRGKRRRAYRSKTTPWWK